jgi:WD40 repeat protein
VALSYQQNEIGPAGIISHQPVKTIDLRNVATGKKLHTQEGHTDGVICFAFAPDGKTLASGGRDDPNVRIWDTATGKQIRALEMNDANVRSVAFAPDGKTLATSEDRAIQFWDLATGKFLREAEQRGCYSLFFFPDGKAIAGINKDTNADSFGDKVRVFDVATKKQLRAWELKGVNPRGTLRYLTVSPDGKVIATSGNTPTFDLWDVATGKLLHDLERHRNTVSAITFSSDGRTLFSADPAGRTIVEWDTASSKLPRQFGKGPNGASDYNAANKLDLSSDARFLALSRFGQGPDYTIHLVGVATGKEVRQFKGHTGMVNYASFSADGTMIASESWADKTLRLWSVATGREQQVISLNLGPLVAPLALSPDGKIVAAGGVAGYLDVQLWDTATGKVLHTLTTPVEIQIRQRIAQAAVMIAFAPDGKLLATRAMNSSSICLWDVASWKLVRHLNADNRWNRIEFSPDGRTLAVGGSVFGSTDLEDNKVSLWQVATGRERTHFLGHRGGISSLAFSPDGTRLASGSADTTILIWDVTGWARAPRPAEQPLSPKELEGLWTDLTGEDAAKAHRALWGLVAAPREAVPLLKQRLEPASPPSNKEREQVARLLSYLTTGEFAARQKAEAELVKLGTPILPLLRKAAQEEGLQLEARRRLENLIERLLKMGEGDRVRHTRVLEVLEHLGTPEAKDLLKTYAAGVPGAWLTEEAKASLQRLARRAVPPRRESLPE